jgi:hypothetical protein
MLGLVVWPAIGLLAAGCSNPQEGTVTVSPEARARIRGGPPPQKAKGTGKGLPVIDVREKQRRSPGG